jgi:hypothetical protein
MVSRPFYPDLILNMGESGLTQKPLKGTQKTCAFLRTMDIKP